MTLHMDIKTDFGPAFRLIEEGGKQARFAAAVAINRSLEWAETAVRKEMRQVFDRPTPYFLRSLRVVRATKSRLEGVLWFKDKGLDDGGEAMVLPHVDGGERRRFKLMEQRMHEAGLLPAGWYVVPGQGASVDAFGNMSRGQISQILGVLGTFREAGYNKANAKTKERLRKGNAKKGIYGFEYFVNRVGSGARGSHLPPGIYKRVYTGFGQAVVPMMIFVRRVHYEPRLNFYGITQVTVERRFPEEFERAHQAALRTAR